MNEIRPEVINNPNELYHHGVKGMKWGVRNKKNERYSVNQRIRDENVYGKSGVRRINRTMNEGTGDIMTDTIVKSAIVYGGAKAGDVIGRHGGQDVAMIAGGYKPGKFRY